MWKRYKHLDFAMLRIIGGRNACSLLRLGHLGQTHVTDDEMVLDVAVSGRAEAIVTFNVRDFLPEARRFNLDVWTPAEALRRLRSG